MLANIYCIMLCDSYYSVSVLTLSSHYSRLHSPVFYDAMH